MTVQALRIELGDTDVTFPIMSDSEYRYFLDKNNQSVPRAILDAAKSILFKLSMRTDETVDIFSIKGNKASAQYMESLKLFIKSPDMNPLLQNAGGWFGGISNSDMSENDSNTDNNFIRNKDTYSTSLTNNGVFTVVNDNSFI